MTVIVGLFYIKICLLNDVSILHEFKDDFLMFDKLF